MPGHRSSKSTGSQAGSAAIGLDITTNHVTVKGLSVTDFSGGGVLIAGGGDGSAYSDTLSGLWVGLDMSALVAGNATFGVELRGEAYSNTLKGDVVAGNQSDGIVIDRSNSNLVTGSDIGTNPAGTAAFQTSAMG